MERFIGVLIEHYSGAFPVWLSPVQTIVIPVGDKFNNYGEKVLAELKKCRHQSRNRQNQRNLRQKNPRQQNQKSPIS